MMIMIMIINAPAETVALVKARAFARKRLQQETSGTDLLQTEARASAPSALQLKQQPQPWAARSVLKLSSKRCSWSR